MACDPKLTRTTRTRTNKDVDLTASRTRTAPCPDRMHLRLKRRFYLKVGGCSGVILVQKSVYSMVSKSPTTSKIFPSRIRMYHV